MVDAEDVSKVYYYYSRSSKLFLPTTFVSPFICQYFTLYVAKSKTRTK